MPTFYVKVESTYPRTFVEEIIEIEAPSELAATEYVLEGDGYLISTKTSYGDPEQEKVIDVEPI